MYGDRLDGFVFGRIVKGTLGAWPSRASIAVDALVASARLPVDRVRLACRRLEEGGLIVCRDDQLTLTSIGASMVRQGLTAVRDEAIGGPVS